MSYKINCFGLTDIGLVRKNNEDAWGCLQDPHFFVLADGLGGYKAGEIASRETVLSLCNYIRELYRCIPAALVSSEEMKGHLRKAILSTNSWVYSLSRGNFNLQGMGTTLCCILFHGSHIVYANIGDSRIYRFRKSIVQITEDHRLAGKQERLKKIVTRALGKHKSVEPDIAVMDVQPGDIFFLCSDGLSDYLTEKQMHSVFSENSCIEKKCHELVMAAKKKGGADNITIVMTQISG